MKQATRDRLNAINLRFYAEHAAAFSASRGRAWPGSQRALERVAAEPALAGRERVRVLDVGCGNGRLIPALRARFGTRLDYTGVDASERLLDLAAQAHSGPELRFVHADFVARDADAALPAGEFELVALLGVLHHVPAAQARAELLRAAAARVAQGGLVVLTLWRLHGARLARLRLPLLAAGAPALEPAELEPGDCLLRFGADGVRYCHLSEPGEVESLCAASGLTPVERFVADGADDAHNEYLLLHAAR